MATTCNSQVLWTIPLMLIVALLCPFAYGNVIYVDGDAVGANDGLSWADAYLCLQDALAVARFSDEIRVARGIYKPDRYFVEGRSPSVLASGDRTETFQLVIGVTIKGGYAGFGEPDPDVRDIDLYETILSGDLNGDDDTGFMSNSENSYHVVTGRGTDETAILDGFIITAGNANGSQPHNEGGGMLNDFGNPIVTNCTFHGNSAEHGGGIRNRDNSPKLTHCTFENNSAGGNGGGIFNDGDQGTPVVTDCIFSGNTADYGAGMNNNNGCSTIVRNCTFTGNSAEDGGGMWNHWNSSPTVTNCTFTSNSAADGGGMYNQTNSNPIVTNCTFTCNSVQYNGGGMENFGNCELTITNCTFSKNSATTGGAIYNVTNSSSTLTNCILWGNTATSGSQLALYENCSFSINYCDLQGGVSEIDIALDSSVIWDLGNIDSDPLFIDSAYGDYHLQHSSPCIDAGDNSAIPPSMVVDLDGNPRITNRIVDMGAYEYSMTSQYLRAGSPTPANGAIRAYTWANLSWRAGDFAVSHDVYFGENFDDVNDGTEGTFRGNQAETFFIVGFPGFLYPYGLVPDTTYYWRIDEVNDIEPNNPWKGDVWSFSIAPKTAYTPKHFEITYYDNYNYDTEQWDAWQTAATPRDAWDDKYLADGFSGKTVFTDHAFTSIPVFDLRGGLFSKDGHASGGEDWNPLQSIGDNVSGQSAHHVFAALFKGLIYLEEGDDLMVASDDDVFVFLDDNTRWGQEVLSIPSVSFFDTDSTTVTAAQAGYHMMTVKFIERLNSHSGIEITLNGEHLQNAEFSGLEDFETGNFSKFSWWHSGDSNWTISQREKHSGDYSAEAGTIGDDEYTTLEITLNCVSGDISFYRKVSSERLFDYLKFYIDGAEQGNWSGEEDWAEVSFPVTAGERTFKWTYSKDYSMADGEDTAWIDDIVFPLKSNPPNGFDLYLDDIAPNIIESSWFSNGLLDFYSEANPVSGDYCIHWTGADLWNSISFRFSPIKDLSVMVDEGFVIDFWVRCDSPNARILIRFMDTNTDDPDDHPWRIIYPIDPNVTVWDGQWNHLQIPLDEFYEQGTYDFDDGRWYDPIGAFDWTATEYFEIVAEYGDLIGIHFYFDDIRVVECF